MGRGGKDSGKAGDLPWSARKRALKKICSLTTIKEIANRNKEKGSGRSTAIWSGVAFSLLAKQKGQFTGNEPTHGGG